MHIFDFFKIYGNEGGGLKTSYKKQGNAKWQSFS